MNRTALALTLASLLNSGCASKSENNDPATSRAKDPITISIIGTSDLHGHIRFLPILAGFVDNLRSVRRKDGAVLLVDAGDMFQGTLESNLTEGASVITIYNAMGYAAATLGNHEFDFGPVGDAVTPTKPGDDPRGAIKARAKQAAFPILAANIAVKETKQRVRWPNVRTHIRPTIAGVSVGIIGITTMDTPHTTLAANFRDLHMIALTDAVVPLATRLREQGANAVIVLAHAGSHCLDLKDAKNTSSCKTDEEIFRFARALPKGSVDVIVAGHTHGTVAHQVNGVAIIQSLAEGHAFGRVDLSFDATTKRLRKARIFPTRWMCNDKRAKADKCETGTYEGKRVVAHPRIAALAKRALKNARRIAGRPLGVNLRANINRSRTQESELGNMLTDLMLAVRPQADVAITNGGGLRADLPAGELTYGRLYEAQPFDNRFATIKLTAKELAAVLAANLSRRGGIFSLSGIHAKADCVGGKLRVQLFRGDDSVVAENTKLTLITNDFLASGGDGAFDSLRKRPGAVTLENGETIRDAIAAELRKRGGSLTGKQFLDPAKRRLQFKGPRPMRCR